MAASQKVHEISTKYCMGINWGHYVIYLQNMKFVRLILWPGGVYTDKAYATTAVISIPYYDSFHESRLYRLIRAMPNEPKNCGLSVVKHLGIHFFFFFFLYQGYYLGVLVHERYSDSQYPCKWGSAVFNALDTN